MSTKKNLKPVSGPYRATKLWNDAVRTFYNEMPLSRHWRGLKQYDNCFTVIEAIDWLHGYLLANPNFGPTVTREQSLKLLRKFFKNGLIIEARGNKIYSEDLQENRELFKFGNQSPLKVLRTPGRTPLAPIIVNALSNNGSSPVLRDDRKKNLGLYNDRISESENTLNEKAENLTSVHKAPSSEELVNKAWQETYFERLEVVSEQLMVGGDGSAPLVPLSYINSSWIKHNVTQIKSSRVSNSEVFGSTLPSWILSAMNCLVNWPNSSDSVCNIPNYPGVEVDIFKVVREFFSDMVVPLIPYDLYDPIIRLYIGAEFLDIAHRTPESGKTLDNDVNHSITSLSSYDSVEDLILNISTGGSHLQENLKNSNRALFSASKIDNEKTGTIQEKKMEKRTPVAALISNGFSSIPNSLRLNKLNNYTNFKDSYLYSKEKQDPSNDVLSKKVPSCTSNRLTLKYLKNKSSLGSCHGDSNECMPSSASPFNEGLKTDELDSYCLPPNSCFETAFTSNSPRTRIIPQKSVDTIHFRHCIQSSRPKSIAVSSFLGMGRSCNELDKRSLINLDKSLSASTYLDKKDSLDRSLSEGNLMKMGKENPPYSSHSHLSRTDGELDGRYCSHKKLNMTSTLAAKVRDSIKRKKAKESKRKHCKGNCGNSKSSNSSKEENSFDNYSSCGNFAESRSVNSFDLMNKMRTRSGGYENPALSLRSLSPDTISNMSDTSTFKNKSGGYINIGIEQSRNGLNYPQDDHKLVTKSYQNYEQQSAFNIITANWKRTTPTHFECSASSTPQPFISRSKSATPDGCLSHSLASTLSNSMYHSALSAFSRTYSNSPVHSGTPVDRHCSMSPPELPKRKPAMQMNSSEFESFRASLLENENPNEHSGEYLKSLSSSANELSDVWVDRTPFGTVPPFMRGGLWRHYHSSPSKRLMGRQHRLHKACGSSVCVPGLLTKVGKEVCVESLQLLLLNLEPERRRKLYLLLKMMNKVSANEKLQIDSLNTNRALMVKTFTRNVLLSCKERDYDEMLATRIVTLLMDNFVNIFSPPQNLAVLVHRKINENISRNECARYSHSRVHHPLTYCHQVSPETFEKQKFSGSQQFLAELLDQLADNPKMSEKDKKKKLKEFKLHYPDIYNHKYPSGKENQEVVLEKKRKLKGLKKLASIRSLGRHKSFRI